MNFTALIDRQIDKTLIDRQIDRLIDKQIGRQIDSQVDRQLLLASSSLGPQVVHHLHLQSSSRWVGRKVQKAEVGKVCRTQMGIMGMRNITFWAFRRIGGQVDISRQVNRQIYLVQHVLILYDLDIFIIFIHIRLHIRLRLFLFLGFRNLLKIQKLWVGFKKH